MAKGRARLRSPRPRSVVILVGIVIIGVVAIIILVVVVVVVIVGNTARSDVRRQRNGSCAPPSSLPPL